MPFTTPKSNLKSNQPRPIFKLILGGPTKKRFEIKSNKLLGFSLKQLHSSSSSFTTLSELTTESNAPLTTSTTLATTTATVDHVQKVLENQDLQHQLLEQLLAKEVQRGMQDGLLNIVAKLGVTDK